MGWSLTTQATPASKIKEAIEGFSLGEGATREDKQQLNAAMVGALEALEREAIFKAGDTDAYVVVQVQGNSTPGHQPVEGYPHSNVTIALFRVASPTVPEQTEEPTPEEETPEEPATPPAASEEGGG